MGYSHPLNHSCMLIHMFKGVSDWVPSHLTRDPVINNPNEQNVYNWAELETNIQKLVVVVVATTQTPSPTASIIIVSLIPNGIAILHYEYMWCHVHAKQTSGADATLLAISCSCPLSRLFHYTGVAV